MTKPEAAERRAHRLVRCYPRAWRARYGAEFVALLIDDMTDRPRSLARTADIIRSALLVRLGEAGLSGDAVSPNRQARAGLCTLSFAVSVFLLAGVALWSQLTIGWQWAQPTAPATRAGMLLMSGALVSCALLGLLAALPILWTLAHDAVTGRGRALAVPLLMIGAGGGVLIAGSLHFGHGWPGTGGHPWAGRDVVPTAIARFGWAATLWITSYWAHPRALGMFPASEIAWMLASPLALASMLIGTTMALRRLRLSARVLRYECWLGLAGALAMAGFLAGAGSWIVSGGPAPRDLFRVGAIDAAGIVVMAAALIVAFRAAQRMLTPRLRPPSAG